MSSLLSSKRSIPFLRSVLLLICVINLRCIVTVNMYMAVPVMRCVPMSERASERNGGKMPFGAADSRFLLFGSQTFDGLDFFFFFLLLKLFVA